MSKQSMREETERLVKQAMERKTVVVKQGKTRIDARCGKCVAPNRVLAAPGQVQLRTHVRNAELNKRRCDEVRRRSSLALVQQRAPQTSRKAVRTRCLTSKMIAVRCGAERTATSLVFENYFAASFFFRCC